LEVEEGIGTKDIDAKGLEPITKLPKYIPSQKGKKKVTKDPYSDKFIISMPLLSEQVLFGGLCLSWIPLLKMEDMDLADLERFLHLATKN